MRDHGPAVSNAGGRAVAANRGNLRLAKTPSRATPQDRTEEPRAESLARLAELLAAQRPYDGSFPLRVPGVHAIRRSTVSRDMVRATVSPALCIVAQGAKVVVLGREVYAYDASRMIAYSVELPVAAQIVRASHREPFLALKLDLHGYKIAELSLKVFPHGVPSPRDTRGVCVGQTTTAIVDAASRLVEMMADPTDAELFAPLVIDEILMRLLRSSIGPRVALLGQQESGVQRVTKAVDVGARALRAADQGGRSRRPRKHEPVVVSPALQGRDVNEPAAVPEGAAAPRGASTDAGPHAGRRQCGPPGGLPQCVAVQPRIHAPLRQRADPRHREVTRGRSACPADRPVARTDDSTDPRTPAPVMPRSPHRGRSRRRVELGAPGILQGHDRAVCGEVGDHICPRAVPRPHRQRAAIRIASLREVHQIGADRLAHLWSRSVVLPW